MTQRYRAEDLLKLRASPLICRPANLPPIEEWMGNQDTATKTRTISKGRHDDNAPHGEIFSKRSNLVESSRKSSTAPEDIVLGPPRRSFASANPRNIHKGTIQEGVEDHGHKDRSSFHERFKNGEDSNEKDVDRKDSRYDAMNGKRMGHYEKEDTRPRRRNDDDDGDGRNRGMGERGKWTARGGREDMESRDDEEGGGGRGGLRRDRARFDQPWARGAKMGESNDEPRRDDRRPHDWRRDRGADREWERPSRVEADPEWMDSGDVDEPAQAHTAEDFQRWKERMKAGGTSSEGKPDALAEQTRQAEEEKKAFKAANARAISQEQNDVMDKFLASFGEQKLDDEKKEAPAKAPVKTRFAAIFSPPPEAQAIKQPTPPPIAQPIQNERPSSSSQNTPLGAADQEGFQRILQMLQVRSNNATPQNQRVQNTRAPGSRGDEAGAQGAQQRPDIDKSRIQPLEDDGSQRSILTERLVDTRSPPLPAHLRQEGGNKHEQQVLLSLLSQADTRAQQPRTQPRVLEQRPGPGVPPYAAMNQLAGSYSQIATGASGRPKHPQERREPDLFFDEPNMFNPREGDHQLRRRPTNEHGLPPFFDDPYMSSLPPLSSVNQQRPKNMSSNSHQNQGLPPGLQRPPGLDQMAPRMPPGWPHQQQQQQPQIQTRQAPPPGILNLPSQRGGMPPGFGSSVPSMQMPPPQQQQQQQAPPRRKYTGDQGPPIPNNFPPGMGPPPGFMGGGGGGGGVPPGFPALGQNYGGRFQPNPAEQDFARDLRLDARYAAEPRGNGLRGGGPGVNPQIPGGYR